MSGIRMRRAGGHILSLPIPTPMFHKLPDKCPMLPDRCPMLLNKCQLLQVTNPSKFGPVY